MTTHSIAELPDGSLVPSQVGLAGALLADALAGGGGLRRRVESVAFFDHYARRQVSLDIDVPPSDQQVPLPLALFAKGETIAAPTVRDEEGHALPLLTSGEAGAVGYVALRLLAARADVQLTFEEDHLLLELATASVPLAARSYEELCARQAAWRDDGLLASAAWVMVGQIVVLALVRSSGGRRLISFTWEEVVTGGGPRTIGAALLGRPGSLAVRMRGLPAVAGDHFEIDAPKGTEITGFTLMGPRTEIPVKEASKGRPRLWLTARDRLPAGESVLLVSLRSASALRRIATLASLVTLLVLLVASAAPAVRNSVGLLLGLLAVPALSLLAAVGWVRVRERGFSAVFALAPLLAALLPLLTMGVLAIAGLAQDLVALTSVAVASGGLIAALERTAFRHRDRPDDPVAWESRDG
jgi:hypothetical protein